MIDTSPDLLAVVLKLILGTLAFVWILWTVRNVNSRAVGMTLTFPTLNGVVLLSVTEGEDKPLKYPTIFNSADVAIITKSDLAEAVEFDSRAMRRNIQAVRPGMRVFQLSAKTGDGVEGYLGFLAERLAESRTMAAV